MKRKRSTKHITSTEQNQAIKQRYALALIRSFTAMTVCKLRLAIFGSVIAIPAVQLFGQTESNIGTSVLGEEAGSPEVMKDSMDWAIMEWLHSAIELPSVGLVVIVVLFAATALIAHSLLTNGKHGWGWVTIGILAATIVFIAKIGLSMFQEMAVSDGPTDWDED